MGKQIEWFTNKAKNLIGTIAFARVGRSWNYAILRRNILGKFQVREIGRDFYNLRQIRIQLISVMTALRKRWFRRAEK